MAVTWDRVKTATVSDTTVRLPWVSPRTPPWFTGIFPISWTPLCHRWGYPIQSSHCYILIPKKSHLIHPPFGSPRHHLNDFLRQGNRILGLFLAWHNTSNSSHKRTLSTLQPNGPISTKPPPTPITPPSYPFQLLCTDYSHYQGVNYLVVIDRHSNWPTIEHCKDGATGLLETLRF
jgi:hypothetical protein